MVSLSGFFTILYGMLLLSRIYAIANAYTFPVDSATVQMLYVAIILLLATVKNKRYIVSKKITEFKIAIILLIGYLVLFGFVFVNPLMAKYTSSIVLRQGLFLAVVISTALFACRNNLLSEIVTTSFWTVALVLCYQFVTNIGDVAKINVATIFSTSSRTRANFGLGHYNYIGMLCTCEIILGVWLLKLRKKQKAVFWVMALSVVMLLGSASRNAIFSIFVFALFCFYFNLDKYPMKKTYKFLVKLFIGILVLFAAVVGDEGFSIEAILKESNRLTLFQVALPTFFGSTRTWTGLGLASGEIYGRNLTPYKTYWLDNGYIYTLITSGYIGAIIYLALIILCLRTFWLIKKKARVTGTLASATFYMYMFTALFETSLFNGGVLINYLWLPIFLIVLDYKATDNAVPINRKKV
ncbi:MAG: ligase [Ruminococcaceae bacterium]|nr:ligase [Oscillospiraceae bacterium]